MKITVNIGPEEYQLPIQSAEREGLNGGTEWRGSLNGTGPANTWVHFFVDKEGGLSLRELGPNISTPSAVLEERFREALEAYHETQNSEFDPEESTVEQEPEPDPYDPDKIKIRRDYFSIREVFDMIQDDKTIDLNPDFQRYFVWDNGQKSLLIESVLLGIPIPLFYFAENRDRSFNVVDGLQRLSTFHQFMTNQFPLKNLEYLGVEYNGKYFKADPEQKIPAGKALPEAMSRRIRQTQLVVNVIEASSPAKVKYDIFKRINTGGKPLNNQEIRNCVAKTTTRNLLRKMSQTDLFRQATGNSVSSQRMDDQELALRFAGFYLVRKKKLQYNGNMTNFLDLTIERLNESENQHIDIHQAFERALKNCFHLFGQYCFRKCLPEHLKLGARRQGINKSLFTSWTAILSEKDPNLVQRFNTKEKFARLQASEFMKKDAFFDTVRNKTNDRLVLEAVFAKTESLVQEHLKTA